MAQAETFSFSGVRVLIGDGADPEVFTAPCGFTERSLTLSKELGETNTPDCTDEDAVSFTERDVVSKSAAIAGQGVLAAAALPTWQGFYDDDTSKNCKVELWRNGAKVGTYSGKFHLETLEIGATKGQRATINVSMQSDGVVAYQAGA